MMNKQTILTSALCGVFLVAAMPDADAATIRVKCEKRAHRSKVSVDGNDLAAGGYRAKIYSGSKRKSSPLQNTVGDEVELDFDSDPDDIAAGATAISLNPTFATEACRGMNSFIIQWVAHKGLYYI